MNREQAVQRNSEPEQSSSSNMSHRRMRRMGVAPSKHLRRHFVALARQIKQWSTIHGRPVKLGVTSLERRVGKSTVAFNLASALTRIVSEKILLLEADFGKHFVSRQLGRAGAPGLSELISTGIDASECILDSPIDNLFVLGSGHVSEQESVEMPFDLLDPVLNNNFEEFGYLVFDLAVACELTSCYSILPSLDGVIIVVDAGKIDRKQIRRAKQKLAACGSELVGLVINQA